VEQRGETEESGEDATTARYVHGPTTVTGGLWGAAAAVIVSTAYIVTLFSTENSSVESTVALVLSTGLFIVAPIGGLIGLFAAAAAVTIAERNTVMGVLVGSIVAYAAIAAFLIMINFAVETLAAPIVAGALGAPALLALNLRTHRVGPRTIAAALAKRPDDS
jgi:hypothetical protein